MKKLASILVAICMIAGLFSGFAVSAAPSEHFKFPKMGPGITQDDFNTLINSISEMESNELVEWVDTMCAIYRIEDILSIYFDEGKDVFLEFLTNAEDLLAQFNENNALGEEEAFVASLKNAATTMYTAYSSLELDLSKMSIETDELKELLKLQFKIAYTNMPISDLCDLLTENVSSFNTDDFAEYSEESVTNLSEAIDSVNVLLEELLADNTLTDDTDFIDSLYEAATDLAMAAFMLEPSQAPVDPTPVDPTPVDPKPSNPDKTPVPPTGASMNHTAAGIVILLGAACALSVFRKKNEE